MVYKNTPTAPAPSGLHPVIKLSEVGEQPKETIKVEDGEVPAAPPMALPAAPPSNNQSNEDAKMEEVKEESKDPKPEESKAQPQ